MIVTKNLDIKTELQLTVIKLYNFNMEQINDFKLCDLMSYIESKDKESHHKFKLRFRKEGWIIWVAGIKKFYHAEAAKEEFRNLIISQGYDSIKTEEGGDNNYYILFEPEQTHILGNKQDLEKFTNFINQFNQ